MPNSNIRFRIFPTPKNLKTKKKVIRIAAINPRLLFSKSMDILQSVALKNRIKKMLFKPNIFGSTK